MHAFGVVKIVFKQPVVLSPKLYLEFVCRYYFYLKNNTLSLEY